MVVVNPAEIGIAHEIRRRIGAPSVYGTKKYGGFEYGAGAEFFGIWQVRSRYRERVQVRMKDYWPKNPQTENQQANRQKYADSIVSWQGLTNEQKEIYNERAKYKPYSGYNLFQKEYILSH